MINIHHRNIPNIRKSDDDNFWRNRSYPGQECQYSKVKDAIQPDQVVKMYLYPFGMQAIVSGTYEIAILHIYYRNCSLIRRMIVTTYYSWHSALDSFSAFHSLLVY